jgi:hypothetical protein
MNTETFDEIIAYARETRYDTQYLWGGEWWYWLKTVHNEPTFWEKGRALFQGEASATSQNLDRGTNP